MDLGGDEPITGSNQALLTKLYIGRSQVKGCSQEQADTYCRIWKEITAAKN